MAESSYDYFFSGPHDAARHLIDSTVQAQGFALEAMPNGTTKAVRGNLATTLLFGGLAGKGFHVTLWLAYFVDDQGRLVARISRDLGTAAVKGGAIGASRAHSAFVDVATALGHAAAASAGHVEGGTPQR
jgi:hypothetical protein